MRNLGILFALLLLTATAHAEVAAIKVTNASSVSLCEVHIWTKKPGHSDADYNFIRGQRINPGQTLPLLDGIPPAKYRVKVLTCDGSVIMDNPAVELTAGFNNKILVH
jgi:hypothetical protein